MPSERFDGGAPPLESDALRTDIRWPERAVIAVSGGLDSTCLLHLASRQPSAATRFRVATFDHATSPASAHALAHVERLADQFGLTIVVGRASATVERTEAAWRAARWRFLRRVGRDWGGPVCTAHTMDDHLETVVMRVLRGTGARGLAGLLARSPGVESPLLRWSRSALEEYGYRENLAWVDDPTNQDRAYFRNRVRLDLLPALHNVRPDVVAELLTIAQRAAEWRQSVDELVESWIRRHGARYLFSEDVLGLHQEGRAIAWQSMLGQVGVILDRRGLARLAAMPAMPATGHVTPLSGKVSLVRMAGGFELVATPNTARIAEAAIPPGTSWGCADWVFQLDAEVGEATAPASDSGISVPADAEIRVRSWQPGDRLVGTGVRGTRRVARYFADARIPHPARQGWPVVLADSEIVWIPGLQPVAAGPVRPGRPTRRLTCERIARK